MVMKFLFTSSWYWIKPTWNIKQRKPVLVSKWYLIGAGQMRKKISYVADMSRHTFFSQTSSIAFVFISWMKQQCAVALNCWDYSGVTWWILLASDSLHVGNISWNMILRPRIKVQLRPQHRWLNSAVLLPANEKIIADFNSAAKFLFSQQRKLERLHKGFMIEIEKLMQTRVQLNELSSLSLSGILKSFDVAQMKEDDFYLNLQ